MGKYFTGILALAVANMVFSASQAEEKLWEWRSLPPRAQIWMCIEDVDLVLVGYYENEEGEMIGLGMAADATVSRFGNTVTANMADTVFQFGKDGAGALSAGSVLVSTCRNVTLQVDNLLSKLNGR